MTNSDPERLDRIEALVEKIGQRVDSNARAIEALNATVTASQQEAQRDRARLYQAMADLAQSQAELAQAQSQMAQTHAQFQRSIYQHQEELDQRQSQLSRRQEEIVEILKLLTSQPESRDRD